MHKLMQQQRRYAGDHLFFFFKEFRKRKLSHNDIRLPWKGQGFKIKKSVRPCSVSTVDIERNLF